ncbi:DUF305 domain-containing protein [Blastococcus tunisiensis]|nr:DUF305 domain-containing protein [Blastococcus sp. DSM 46838]
MGEPPLSYEARPPRCGGFDSATGCHLRRISPLSASCGSRPNAATPPSTCWTGSIRHPDPMDRRYAMTRTTARLVRIAGGLLAGIAVLGGCSGAADGTAADSTTSADSAASVSDQFNDADVAFAQGMIPHHEGALMMAEMALERASDPRVRDLAERIQAGQDPEIELMTGWLEEWGALVESSGMGGMDHGSGGGMDHRSEGMGDMPAAGPDFDVMWMQSMIEHHDGAVIMAQIEIDDGENEEAIDLARLIVETQNDEINQMQQLLNELGG